MRIKSLYPYPRLVGRVRRIGSRRDQTLRAGESTRQPRVWSLLLPPRYPSDRG
jgi:hypothetical protein